MYKRIGWTLLLTVLAALAVACQPPPPAGAGLKIGQVTDVGGIDDRSFNASAWAGVQRAIDDYGVEGQYLESNAPADYQANIQAFLDQDYDLIITVGFLLGEDTQVAAEANRDTKFAIVDFCYDPAVPNIQCILFNTDQAAFLAGYLAAGVTQTGKVGTFGGIPIPPVTIFMDGFLAGVRYYNQQKGTQVEVLGWDGENGLFTNNFESLDDGRTFAENLMDEGADIILPVAGPVGLGSAEAIRARGGAWLIGVDTDWFVSAPEYQDIYLTSIMKQIDNAVYAVSQAVVEGTYDASTPYFGTLANAGVGIAPFHMAEDVVPAELKAELDQIAQGVINGTLSIDPGDYPA